MLTESEAAALKREIRDLLVGEVEWISELNIGDLFEVVDSYQYVRVVQCDISGGTFKIKTPTGELRTVSYRKLLANLMGSSLPYKWFLGSMSEEEIEAARRGAPNAN